MSVESLNASLSYRKFGLLISRQVRNLTENSAAVGNYCNCITELVERLQSSASDGPQYTLKVAAIYYLTESRSQK